MAKFVINRDYDSSPETVNADRYYTDGDFIDFVAYNEHEGREDTILRIKASIVNTVHRDDQ